jgi:hypothetical protein
LSIGWSYEYLSPDNLVAETEAHISDSVFAPARQAFKALVLRGNDTLTVAGVGKLTQYAHEGLPIIISGGTPYNLSGYNVSGTAYVKSALAALIDLETVHEVPAEDLSASLQALGLASRTKVDADRIWYTYWREDEQAAKTYVFVYNDAWDNELGLGGSRLRQFKTSNKTMDVLLYRLSRQATRARSSASTTTSLPLLTIQSDTEDL